MMVESTMAADGANGVVEVLVVEFQNPLDD